MEEVLDPAAVDYIPPYQIYLYVYLYLYLYRIPGNSQTAHPLECFSRPILSEYTDTYTVYQVSRRQHTSWDASRARVSPNIPIPMPYTRHLADSTPVGMLFAADYVRKGIGAAQNESGVFEAFLTTSKKQQLPVRNQVYNVYWLSGVPGGPIVSRVTTEVEVVGSNLTSDNYESAGRKCESVSWRNSMQIEEHKKLKSGNAEPYAR